MLLDVTEIEIAYRFFDDTVWIYFILIKFSTILEIFTVPLVFYIIWTCTPRGIIRYRYTAIGTLLCQLTHSVIFLLWQPVHLSPLYLVYSAGPLSTAGPKVFYLAFSFLIITYSHSLFSLYLCLLSRYHYSLPEGDHFFSNKLKIISTSTFVYLTLIATNCFNIIFIFPDSKLNLSKLYIDYPFLNNFMSNKLAGYFVIDPEVDYQARVFLIGNLMTSSLAFALYAILAGYFYFLYKKLSNPISSGTLKLLHQLQLALRVRVAIFMAFSICPIILWGLCIYYQLGPWTTSICIIFITYHPLIDMTASVYLMKPYREKFLEIFKLQKFNRIEKESQPSFSVTRN